MSLIRDTITILKKEFENTNLLKKKNLMEIRANNSDPKSTSTAGLNEYSDLTFEEFSQYFNIKPIDVKKIKVGIDRQNQRNGFRLDDYNDDYDTNTIKASTPTLYDYRSYFLGIRNQGSCSSCWAFATMAQLESTYWMKHSTTAGAVNQYLSVQQLVDCDTTSDGCNYGYPSEAMTYLQSDYAMPDSSYTYTGVTGTCKYSSAKTTPVRVTGVRYGGTYYYQWYPIYVTGLLANGPVVVLVGANAAFQNYAGGIFSAACANGVNHSIVVVGYGYNSSTNQYYYIVRNSWGTSWGISGYMYVLDDGIACSIPMYGYQASIS